MACLSPPCHGPCDSRHLQVTLQRGRGPGRRHRALSAPTPPPGPRHRAAGRTRRGYHRRLGAGPAPQPGYRTCLTPSRAPGAPRGRGAGGGVPITPRAKAVPGAERVVPVPGQTPVLSPSVPRAHCGAPWEGGRVQRAGGVGGETCPGGVLHWEGGGSYCTPGAGAPVPTPGDALGHRGEPCRGQWGGKAAPSGRGGGSSRPAPPHSGTGPGSRRAGRGRPLLAAGGAVCVRDGGTGMAAEGRRGTGKGASPTPASHPGAGKDREPGGHGGRTDSRRWLSVLLRTPNLVQIPEGAAGNSCPWAQPRPAAGRGKRHRQGKGRVKAGPGSAPVPGAPAASPPAQQKAPHSRYPSSSRGWAAQVPAPPGEGAGRAGSPRQDPAPLP